MGKIILCIGPFFRLSVQCLDFRGFLIRLSIIPIQLHCKSGVDIFQTSCAITWSSGIFSFEECRDNEVIKSIGWLVFTA